MTNSILLIVFAVAVALSLFIKFKSFEKEQERSDAIAEKQLEEIQARIEELKSVKEYYESLTFTAVKEDD